MSYLYLSLSTYILNMVSSTQTLAQIKSEKYIGNINQHFITSHLTYITNGIHYFVKCWMNLKLQPVNMLFARLQASITFVKQTEVLH